MNHIYEYIFDIFTYLAASLPKLSWLCDQQLEAQVLQIFDGDLPLQKYALCKRMFCLLTKSIESKSVRDGDESKSVRDGDIPELACLLNSLIGEQTEAKWE